MAQTGVDEDFITSPGITKERLHNSVPCRHTSLSKPERHLKEAWQVNAHPQLYPGDIIEFPRNKYFSHFGVYYGERDGVPYVAHLTSRDSDSKLLLFGRALKSTVKLDPVDVVGKKYKVRNYLDEKHPPRDFYSLVKPEIDEAIGKMVTYDILFHNSEHQATMFRYGVKKSEQIEKVYAKIVPTWKSLFEKKKM